MQLQHSKQPQINKGGYEYKAVTIQHVGFWNPWQSHDVRVHGCMQGTLEQPAYRGTSPELGP